MFIRKNKISELENFISNSFSLYRETILKLHSKQWKEEDISGNSCIQYKIYQYHLAVYYVILIYIELKQGINTNWGYYQEKYKIETISKCLACDDINLEGILEKFGLLTTNCDGGIECVEIESSFEIEPEFLTIPTIYEKVIINDILENLNQCEILLSSRCTENIDLDYILQLNINQEFLIL